MSLEAPDPPDDTAELRVKSVSPVSPKPVHLPAPANIPILEHSMDPAYDDTVSFTAIANQTDAASVADTAADYTMGVDGADEPRPVTGASSSQVQAKGNGGSGETAHNSDDKNGEHGQAGPGVDYQSLLASLTSASSPPPVATAPASSTATLARVSAANLPANPLAVITSSQALPHGSASGNITSPGASNGQPAALSSLPPRPPPQARPSTHPNYAPGDDIRAYHPHSRDGNPQASYRAQAGAAPHLAAAVGANGLPPPPNASFQQPTLMSPTSADGENQDLSKGPAPGSRKRDLSPPFEAEQPWSPGVQRLYDDFLRSERMYVTEGQWDRFPPNSRLFVGNLPTEKVTKRDLFHIFHRYGKIAQISIKQAFGFVQFLEGDACVRAVQGSQGRAVRGKAMNLEISKPQKNTRPMDGGRGTKRSRSPDRGRNRGGDKYVGPAASQRDRGFRRGHDDYRPMRSPSPRRNQRRSGRSNSLDRHTGRQRSRSRSPRGEGRQRNPNPPTNNDGDDLPLPRRKRDEVPDVQFLIVDDLHREFFHFVEQAFKSRQLRCDVLVLNPRLPETAVIRRQVIEGVQAVSKLSLHSSRTSRIPLQVFDRRGGLDNVKFNEYKDLEPHVAAELVVRAKADHNSERIQHSGYGLPASYGLPPQAPSQERRQSIPTQGVPQTPDLSSVVRSLDPASLQQLLGALQPDAPSHLAAQPQHQQASQSSLSPDLMRLLSQVSQESQPRKPNQYGGPVDHQATAGAPALSNWLGGIAPARPQVHQQTTENGGQNAVGQNQPDMQQIIAQLSAYQR